MPNLVLPDAINFGVTTADGRVLKQFIEVRNIGSVTGTFSIVYDGGLPLTFWPDQGTVAPGDGISIRVNTALTIQLFLLATIPTEQPQQFHCLLLSLLLKKLTK